MIKSLSSLLKMQENSLLHFRNQSLRVLLTFTCLHYHFHQGHQWCQDNTKHNSQEHCMFWMEDRDIGQQSSTFCKVMIIGLPLLHSHLMESTLHLAQGTRQSGCGMLKLVKLCLVHLLAMTDMSPLLHSHLMESTLHLAHRTRQSGCGMLKLVKLCLVHLLAMMILSPLFHSHLMESTLHLAHRTRQSGCGMLKLVKLCLVHLLAMMNMSPLLHSHLMESTLHLAHRTT